MASDEHRDHGSQEFCAYFDSAPTAMFVFAPDGRPMRANASACRLVGRSLEELTGMHRLAQTRAWAHDAMLDFLKSVEIHGRASRLLELLRNDGVAVPTELDGVWVGEQCLVCCRDVSEERKSEAAFHQQRVFLDRVIETSPAGIVAVDENGTVTFANREAEQVLGLSRTSDRLHYNDPRWQIDALDGSPFPEEELPFYRVRATRKPVRDIRHAIQCGDRRTFLSINAAPLVDDEDDFRGMVATVEDITERMQSDGALRDSEERFRNVIQALPMGVHFYRLEPDGRLVFEGANPAADALLGVPNAQFIGNTIEEAFPPLQETEIPKHYRQVARSGTVWHTQQIHYDDRKIRGAYEVCAFRTSSNRMAATFIDVTTRLRTEKALAESEARFRLLVQHSTDIMAVVTPDGHFKFISPSIQPAAGRSPEDLLGMSLYHYVHPDDLGVATTMLSSLANRPGANARAELRWRHADEFWTHLEAIATNLVHEPTVDGILLNIRNVTERCRAAEENAKLEEKLRQSQKMEAVGRLAGGIAHDFNNLLTAITGYSDMLMHTLPPNSPHAADVREIYSAAERAAGLTAQLLAFSRRQVILPRLVDLNQLLESSSRMLTRIIGEDIDFRLVLQPKLHLILADSSQLEQTLVNLVVNARDAMPHGGRLIVETANVFIDEYYTNTHPDATPGEHVILAVADNGRGIPNDVLEHIFEPFFTTKDGKGTGLGLSTVYGIVRQNGGFVEVHSEIDIGTTFKIFLRAASKRTADSVPPPSVSQPPGGSESILLVEDEDAVRQLAKVILQRNGYTVSAATSAAEALDILTTNPSGFQLLLTDVVMRGMNGKQLCEKARVLWPSLKVLFMSGYTANVIEHHGVLDEGTKFLQKPFSIVALLNKVREALDELGSTH